MKILVYNKKVGENCEKPNFGPILAGLAKIWALKIFLVGFTSTRS